MENKAPALLQYALAAIIIISFRWPANDLPKAIDWLMRHQLSQCFKPRQLVVLLQLLQQLRGIGRQQALAPGGLKPF